MLAVNDIILGNIVLLVEEKDFDKGNVYDMSLYFEAIFTPKGLFCHDQTLFFFGQ